MKTKTTILSQIFFTHLRFSGRVLAVSDDGITPTCFALMVQKLSPQIWFLYLIFNYNDGENVNIRIESFFFRFLMISISVCPIEILMAIYGVGLYFCLSFVYQIIVWPQLHVTHVTLPCAFITCIKYLDSVGQR